MKNLKPSLIAVIISMTLLAIPLASNAASIGTHVTTSVYDISWNPGGF